MSSKFEKLVARQELMRRRGEAFEREVKEIQNLSTHELEAILEEPEEQENNE